MNFAAGLITGVLLVVLVGLIEKRVEPVHIDEGAVAMYGAR